MVYKTYNKKFLGKEVRMINVNGKAYIILKDMFGVLGRLRSDNGQINDKDSSKLINFLQGLGKSCDTKKLRITSKSGKSKSRETQEVWCLKLETAPVVLTQFKPSNSSKRTQEENEQVLNEWFDFMKFVNDLLVVAKAEEFITMDKKHQVKAHDRLQELLPENEKSNPNNYKRLNTDVAYIMGDLISNHPTFKPEIIRIRNEETIDELKLREEVIDVYLNIFELFNDFDIAKRQTIKVMNRRLNN